MISRELLGGLRVCGLTEVVHIRGPSRRYSAIVLIVSLAIFLIVIGLVALLPFEWVPDTKTNLINGLSPAMVIVGVLLLVMRVLA